MPCPSDEIIESIKECEDKAKLVKILVNKIQYDDDNDYNDDDNDYNDYNDDNDDNDYDDYNDEKLLKDFMSEQNIDPNIFLTKTKSDKKLEELQREISKDDSYDSDDSGVEDLIAKMKDVYGIDDSELNNLGGGLKKRKKSKRKKKSKSSKKSKKSTESKKSKTKSKKSKRVKRSRTKKNKRVKRTLRK